MSKKNITFFILLLLAGCCKDEPLVTDTPPPVVIRPPHPMIKTITATDYQGTVTTQYYYYDTLWRLIKYERHSPSGIFIDSVTYYATYVSRSNSLDFGLNSNGLVQQDDNTSYAQRHYSYNTDGYLVNEHSMSGSADYLYNSNHNVIERQSRVEANPHNLYYHHYFAYNSQINTIGNYNKGEYYFGKSSTNLMEREDWHFYLNTPFDSVLNFTLYNYTYNDSGWVSGMEQNAAQISTTQIDSVTFTYDTTYSVYQSAYTYY